MLGHRRTVVVSTDNEVSVMLQALCLHSILDVLRLVCPSKGKILRVSMAMIESQSY